MQTSTADSHALVRTARGLASFRDKAMMATLSRMSRSRNIGQHLSPAGSALRGDSSSVAGVVGGHAPSGQVGERGLVHAAEGGEDFFVVFAQQGCGSMDGGPGARQHDG